MTKYKKTELVLNKAFDTASCRHKIADDTVVLHCHHFSSLYTQLAMDCSMLDAKALLAECSEDAWKDFLGEYYRANGITKLAERIALAEQAFAAAGLGRMRVTCAGSESGEVTLESSHLDSGWLKKWGQSNSPVNFIASGFISALFAAAFNRPVRSYVATETQSIACGAPCSRFTVVVR